MSLSLFCSLIFRFYRTIMVNRKVKLLIPKDRAELVPIFFVLFLICVYVIFELYVVLPAIYNNIFTYKEICHLIFGFYVIFNLLGNLLLSMITDTSIDTIICPVLLPAPTVRAPPSMSNTDQDLISHHCNWHYCYGCEVNVPARAQHCHLCKKCILKRDHHCSFLGRCIGFRNIRYYMCFLLWTWVILFSRIEILRNLSKKLFRSVYSIAIFYTWIILMNWSVRFLGVFSSVSSV